MNAIWTLDGDDTSWSSWADDKKLAPSSPFIQDLIAANQASHQQWAIDIGCGTGRAFLPLVEAGYRVIGIDPIISGLRSCQQRVSQATISAYPVLASATHIPMHDQSVSFVFAVSILFHLSLPELMGALLEIYRVLLPDGKAILHFLDIEDWRHTLAKQIPPEKAPIPSYQAVVTCFSSEAKIREWIHQSGLQLEKLELKINSHEPGQQRNWLAYCVKLTR